MDTISKSDTVIKDDAKVAANTIKPKTTRVTTAQKPTPVSKKPVAKTSSGVKKVLPKVATSNTKKEEEKSNALFPFTDKSEIPSKIKNIKGSVISEIENLATKSGKNMKSLLKKTEKKIKVLKSKLKKTLKNAKKKLKKKTAKLKAKKSELKKVKSKAKKKSKKKSKK